MCRLLCYEGEASTWHLKVRGKKRRESPLEPPASATDGHWGGTAGITPGPVGTVLTAHPTIEIRLCRPVSTLVQL